MIPRVAIRSPYFAKSVGEASCRNTGSNAARATFQAKQIWFHGKLTDVVESNGKLFV